MPSSDPINLLELTPVDTNSQDPMLNSYCPPAHVDLSKFKSQHSLANKLGRCLWGFVWLVLFRPSPRTLHGWRCVLLRAFGARIGRNVRVYPSAHIWIPWNLEMEDHSCMGLGVDCYCIAPIKLESHSMVSQYSYLCSATHDYEHPHLPLIAKPITIGRGAWITADVFVGPGVTIGEGAVVGARSSVFKNVPPWTVVAGNPARFLKQRVLKRV